MEVLVLNIQIQIDKKFLKMHNCTSPNDLLVLGIMRICKEFLDLPFRRTPAHNQPHTVRRCLPDNRTVSVPGVKIAEYF